MQMRSSASVSSDIKCNNLFFSGMRGQVIPACARLSLSLSQARHLSERLTSVLEINRHELEQQSKPGNDEETSEPSTALNEAIVCEICCDTGDSYTEDVRGG